MPAVLVHGVPDTYRLWDFLARCLSRTDVIAIRLPGFGCPVSASFDATKEAYVDWLIEQLDDLGEPVDLVGHDWGSALVQRVVSLRPDLARTWAAGGLAIDAEYVWHQLAQTWQTPEVGEKVMVAFGGESLKAGLEAGGVPEADAAVTVRHIDDLMKDCILKLYRSARTFGKEWQPDLEKVSVPALIIWGSDDPYISPSFGEHLADRVGGEFVLIERCGHWWPTQRAADAARVLEAFWTRYE